MRRIAAVLVLLIVTTGAVASSSLDVTVLTRPGFPAPAGDVTPTGAELVLVSSRYRSPALLPPARPDPPTWAPRRFRGDDLQDAVRQGGKLFLLYGPDASSVRLVVRASPQTHALRYAFDFRSFVRPPGGGETEPVTWVREVNGILYISNSHLTYASATKGRNAYVSAIHLGRKQTLWRSSALVANARTFAVVDDLIVAGYGFTAEPDFLYLLDRWTGKILDRLELATGPERIKLRGDRLHVRTYDRDIVARIVGG